MPHLVQKDAEELIKLRHGEWWEHEREWRWLQDSLEGGARYRDANYMDDALGEKASPAGLPEPKDGETMLVYGEQTLRNLIPHVSETTKEGRPTYAMRLARTPVPRTVSRAVNRHLARIYAQDPVREAPDPLVEWWADVDGAGTTVDKWMRKTVAPLFLVLGQLDLVFDHPPAPEGVQIATRADAARYGLTACVCGYVLPENMVWWDVDPRTRAYSECLVFERCHDGRRYRHWTATDSNAYDGDGRWIPDASREHPFGRPPIVRVFDQRKHRCGNVGQSRYESIAELQKAIYNARSELILGDVQQSHAILQGPKEYVTGDGQMEISPQRVLPIAMDGAGNQSEWGYLDPPKGGIQEVRLHVIDFMEEADRDASLLKPAGMVAGSTVAQSGISKQIDQQDGNDVLSEVSETLADAEVSIARMALLVLSDGRITPGADDAIKVAYPKEFGLASSTELAASMVEFQGIAAAAGELPECTSEGLKRLVAAMLPGLSDERMAELNDEIDAFVDEKAGERSMNSEALAASLGGQDNNVGAFGPGGPAGADVNIPPVDPNADAIHA